MASNFFKRLDSKRQAELTKRFNEKPLDIEKVRRAALKSLDTTLNQFRSATPARGKKSFKIGNNGVVSWNLPIAYGQATEIKEDSADFEAAIADYREWLNSPEANESLTEHAKDNAGSTKSGRGWPPERRAKFEATIAARQAAKK